MCGCVAGVEAVLWTNWLADGSEDGHWSITGWSVGMIWYHVAWHSEARDRPVF